MKDRHNLERNRNFEAIFINNSKYVNKEMQRGERGAERQGLYLEEESCGEIGITF